MSKASIKVHSRHEFEASGSFFWQEQPIFMLFLSLGSWPCFGCLWSTLSMDRSTLFMLGECFRFMQRAIQGVLPTSSEWWDAWPLTWSEVPWRSDVQGRRHLWAFIGRSSWSRRRTLDMLLFFPEISSHLYISLDLLLCYIFLNFFVIYYKIKL